MSPPNDVQVQRMTRNNSSRRGSYVVWRKSKKSTGVGFFSIITSVLAQFDVAEKKNLVPVVDFERNFSTYQEQNAINGSSNMWEYYFEQPAGRSLREVESGAEKSDGTHPAGYAYDLSADSRYRELWDRYVILKESSRSYVEGSLSALPVNKDTLGVHFRGGDMRTARGHKFPPTQRQMNQAITWALDNGNLNHILLVTDSMQYQQSFIRRWGSRITATPSYKLLYGNPYTVKSNPRHQHRYLLGLETLRDAVALSRCGALICGRSNLSEASIMLGRENLEFTIRISQGSNSGNPVLAPFLWYAKATLPGKLGGFPPWKP